MKRVLEALLRKTRDERGFTLVELIVVIAILGILAAIAVPSFKGTLSNARSNADKATARIIADAAVRYITDQVANGGSVPTGISVDDLVNNGYLSEKPKSQSSPGTDFTISIDTANNKVTVSIGSISVTQGYSY